MVDFMKIHILGICGTFMGSLAILAAKQGMRVTGQDQNVYPPMSTQLEAQGIGLISGFEIADMPADVDCVVVGNVMRRGMPIVEHLLNQKIPYLSGPDFLAKYILRDQHVLVVSGTHGKTTTSSMLAWILQYAGLDPGFLIGGIPNNFGVSAALGDGKYFVIEGDEYDCAFFDKRSKFLHYRPQTLIINNIEFDHADIFKDLEAIITQFHHLMRILPGDGNLIYRDDDPNIAQVLSLGSWTKPEVFNTLDVEIPDNIIGAHNILNAKAALLAASKVGVPFNVGLLALAEFTGVKRRLEFKGEREGVKVYSDFAHHPTAIKTTIEGMPAKRVIAIIDLCSNTMRAGVHKDTLLPATSAAAAVFFYAKEPLAWAQALPNFYTDQTQLADALQALLRPQDLVLLMSNGAFESFADVLLARLSVLA